MNPSAVSAFNYGWDILRNTWSIANAFTSAFKELEPIPQFTATAKLAPFNERIK
jgi:hypothetical protein